MSCLLYLLLWSSCNKWKQASEVIWWRAAAQPHTRISICIHLCTHSDAISGEPPSQKIHFSLGTWRNKFARLENVKNVAVIWRWASVDVCMPLFCQDMARHSFSHRCKFNHGVGGDLRWMVIPFRSLLHPFPGSRYCSTHVSPIPFPTPHSPPLT